MPRPLRIDLIDLPQHVVQRGNDRQPCFLDESDYHFYRTELRLMAAREGCEVHAYALMTNHVHLLVTPREKGAVSRTMQSLGRRYVRYFNDRLLRTGTLWEGRYKTSLVGDGVYLMNCHRYIELNPVRARMVHDPANYPWSSHATLALGTQDPLVSPHPYYLALSDSPAVRQRMYRELVLSGLDQSEVEVIRSNLHRQHAYGTASFRREVEARSGVAVAPQRVGRPSKKS